MWACSSYRFFVECGSVIITVSVERGSVVVVFHNVFHQVEQIDVESFIVGHEGLVL